REALAVVELTGDEAVTVELHLVLLLRTPLPVAEDHGSDRDVMADRGEDLDHAHRPGAVTGVGDGRTLGSGPLGADDRRQRVAAVAEAHRGEEAARTLEPQVAVGDGVDVA